MALALSIFLYCKESHGGHQRAHSVYTGPKGLALREQGESKGPATSGAIGTPKDCGATASGI